MDNPSYTDEYIGKAIYLNGLNQYVDTSVVVNISNRSFTVEVRVDWLDLYNFIFNEIFGQCSCDNFFMNKCLHLLIRDKFAYLEFYENDIKGYTIILNVIWIHLTFVYNYELRQE